MLYSYSLLCEVGVVIVDMLTFILFGRERFLFSYGSSLLRQDSGLSFEEVLIVMFPHGGTM